MSRGKYLKPSKMWTLGPKISPLSLADDVQAMDVAANDHLPSMGFLGLCQHCQAEPEESAHLCPYRADIYGDTISSCRCCPACTTECARDI